MTEDDAIFNRDKFALNLLIKRYEEQERKVSIVDDKISKMIAIIGVLLSVQGSIFTFLLSWFMKNNVCLLDIIFFVLFLTLVGIILGFYALSMKKFIDSYYFKKFKAFPNAGELISLIDNEEYSEYDLTCELIGTVADIIEYNTKEIKRKVATAKEGFVYFENAGIFSISFVLLFSIIIVVV